MDTILITGGNGNLDRLMAERFETRGTKIISFDCPAPRALTATPATPLWRAISAIPIF